MLRRTFFQALFQAKGAKPVTEYSDGCWTAPLRCGNVPNGECPTCGVRTTDYKQGQSQSNTILETGDGRRLVSCLRCNTVFAQKPGE